jgi:signal transduction histidine kinase
MTLELGAASVPGLVDACLRGVQGEADARGVGLEARIPGPVPDVRCAPGKVERVLHNLLSNALRHTPSHGSVAVLVEPDGDAVRVAVEDTGDGMPIDAIDQAFDSVAGRDAPLPRRGGGGSGLGLVIARGLIEAQGGRVWAERRPGGGTRVCFTLRTAAPAP